MSRRQTTRPASPEAVFAKRRGEIPYQIYFEVSNIGRNVESSKKRARWKFCFGEEGREHEVTLVHSLMSGKKRTIFDGEVINEAQKVTKEWVFAWSYGAHLLRVGINFEEYGLVIDGIPFRNFSRRDPYLAAQLEATKRDSMRSLQADEKRRFDRLGYAGGGGGGGRSRAAERGRDNDGGGGGGASSSRDASSQRRASSNGRGTRSRDGGGGGGGGGGYRRESGDSGRAASANRRSGSVEGRRRSSPAPARSSSGRRMQAPPSASGPGPGGDHRKSSQGSGGRGSSTKSSAAAAAAAAVANDILSADPSTLEVNPFDADVPAASFDPLANGKGPAAGGGYTNGVGGGSGGGGGGGWGGGGGGGYGGGGGGGADSAAVLQLGMQFEAMGTSSQFQQPPPQQQQQPFVHQQQPQQQQQYQTPFDQGAYQQFDQSGFPLQQQQQPQQQQQQQQQYNPSQQQQQSLPFGDSGNLGYSGSGSGGASFSGTFPQQQQQQQQQQQGTSAAGAASNPPAVTCTELAKTSADPWDMARSGMVNIDDITDTKHLPPVEVKPFTNDHRPLADLVREAPPKVAKPVMIERPEPPPTHVAVAIMPVQGQGQQQNGYAQGGFPQQPQNANGNPFAQLQLTQFGQQAQPVLFSNTPADPFHRL